LKPSSDGELDVSKMVISKRDQIRHLLGAARRVVKFKAGSSSSSGHRVHLRDSVNECKPR
jgi:hypothetical protein